MKRFFLLIVLVMLVSWITASRRSPFRRPAESPRHWAAERYVDDAESGRRNSTDTRRNTQRALAQARDEVRDAFDEARDEVHKALDQARDELQKAFDEVRVTVVSDDEPRPALPPVPPSPATASEAAEGLPVPIMPGTRVTEAEARPPVPRGSAIAVVPTASAESSRWTVPGRLSANPERAVADARRALREKVASWLDPEVPRSWTPPARMFDAMIVDQPRLKSIQKDYGELFEATLTVDASPPRRTAMIEVYNRQLVERRLAALGATLAFILICLAAVSGYIRADEATKGYYTNRLRMLAAAGVGASGVIIYHMVV
jgi:nucleotide-binding universal stress UspA family protein